MSRDSVTGAVAIHQQHCIGCLECAEACPFDAIWVGPNREMLKCDLCDGDPMCVRYCPAKPIPDPETSSNSYFSCLQYVEPRRVNRG
jgi:Fe-S-cluster-containing hydrogenase component 2